MSLDCGILHQTERSHFVSAAILITINYSVTKQSRHSRTSRAKTQLNYGPFTVLSIINLPNQDCRAETPNQRWQLPACLLPAEEVTGEWRNTNRQLGSAFSAPEPTQVPGTLPARCLRQQRCRAVSPQVPASDSLPTPASFHFCTQKCFRGERSTSLHLRAFPNALAFLVLAWVMSF